MVARASTSASSLARQVGGLLLSSSSRATVSAGCSALPAPVAPSVRHSHVGSAPLEVPAAASIEILPFPPHPNPSRPLLPSLRHARSAVVKGPKGEVVVPLHDCVTVSTGSASSSAAQLAATGSGATIAESSRISLAIQDDKSKKQRGTWGLTRSLLHNALVGVTEGHTFSLRLVGVGYRASIEADPLPRLSKLDMALAGSKSFFTSDAAKHAEVQREIRLKKSAEAQGNMRLHIRLGYSHPVLIPVPYGIQVQIPQPNRIVIKGADKEQLGLFASQIRSWRKPEPYKGKGIFVDDETIRIKTAKKK